MIKVSDDGVNHTEIQVCGDPNTQTADACHPYVCEGKFEDDNYTISRSFQCLDVINLKDDLEGTNFTNIALVNNSEDWFSRINYWFEI